jgi:hypothetical protein
LIILSEDMQIVHLELGFDEPSIAEGEFLADFEAAAEVYVAVVGGELGGAVGGFQVVINTGSFEGGIDVEAAGVQPGGVEAAVVRVDLTVSAGGAVVYIAAAIAGVDAEVEVVVSVEGELMVSAEIDAVDELFVGFA